MFSALAIKFIVGGLGTASVVGAGTAAYIKRDTIIKAFKKAPDQSNTTNTLLDQSDNNAQEGGVIGSSVVGGDQQILQPKKVKAALQKKKEAAHNSVVTDSTYNYISAKLLGNIETTDLELTSGTNQNYACELTFLTVNYLDKSCVLYKANKNESTDSTIDLSSDLASRELKAKEDLTSSKPVLIKVATKFFSYFTNIQDDKVINLVDKTDSSKTIATLAKEFDITNKTTDTLTDPHSNIFLFRNKTAGSSKDFDGSKVDFACFIDSTKHACKVYSINGKPDTNNLTSQQLSSLKAPVADANTAGKYLVVDLLASSKKHSDLKNKEIKIFTKSTTVNTDSTNLITTTILDQILLGMIPKDLTEAAVYPLTPKFESYLVSNTVVNDFNDLKSGDQKNYQCKFASDANENYDSSCFIKALPALTDPTKIHSYATLFETTKLTNPEANALTKANYFVLTVDSNKLFNLSPNWTTENTAAITLDIKAGTKTSTLTLNQKLVTTKPLGKTKLALVKFKSKVASATDPKPAAGKCALSTDDTTGFACTFKKATVASGDTSYVKTIWTDQDFDVGTANESSYFVVVSTDAKNITDFDNKNLLYYTDTASTKNTSTFDIIALMGGDSTKDGTNYFLEEPRTITGS